MSQPTNTTENHSGVTDSLKSATAPTANSAGQIFAVSSATTADDAVHMA